SVEHVARDQDKIRREAHELPDGPLECRRDVTLAQVHPVLDPAMRAEAEVEIGEVGGDHDVGESSPSLVTSAGITSSRCGEAAGPSSSRSMRSLESGGAPAPCPPWASGGTAAPADWIIAPRDRSTRQATRSDAGIGARGSRSPVPTNPSAAPKLATDATAAPRS